ncbi:MAG: hypothetical protein WCW66_02065 [Patescibacteria group bacterium]
MSKDIPETMSHVLKRLPFNPEQFPGKGWKINNEQVGVRVGDSLDASRIVGKDYLREGELFLNGEERLRRIRNAPDIQLDASDFLALWQEEGHITLRLLYATRGVSWLSFWGTILCDSSGDHYVLYLCRSHDGSWYRRYRLIYGGSWFASDPAGVLA